MALTECSTDVTGLCNLEPAAPSRRNQQIINQAVRGVLERITLSDLVQPMQLTTIKDARGKLVPTIALRENSMSSNTDAIRELAQQEYKWGFVTDIDEDRAPKGLNEDIIRLISAKKNEPEFMLEWRLKAYRHWASLEKAQAEPKWANIKYPPIDYQNIIYYSAPKQKPNLKSLDELDPEILRTYEKLGIPLEEQKMLAGVAVDAVFDSVSVATTFKGKLAEAGIIFCSFSEAVQEHPDLVKKYLGIGGALHRQFLRGAQCGCLHRRLVRLRAQGRSLPDGAFDLFPHQRGRDRAVRAHADRRRRRRLRQLSRRLHGADAR